ncbi:MAG TPA: hypothetical protein VGR16_15265 [Thermomicrobiales bacterium]|nr:hypothetical protein [Thermomicrobiales bacterium]
MGEAVDLLVALDVQGYGHNDAMFRRIMEVSDVRRPALRSEPIEVRDRVTDDDHQPLRSGDEPNVDTGSLAKDDHRH